MKIKRVVSCLLMLSMIVVLISCGKSSDSAQTNIFEYAVDTSNDCLVPKQIDYLMSVEELMPLIRRKKEVYQEKLELIKAKEDDLKNTSVSYEEWDDIRKSIPTWQEVFLNADKETKRVLVNKLIERIEVKKDEVVVKFKIDLREFVAQPRITDDHGTIPCTHGLR